MTNLSSSLSPFEKKVLDSYVAFANDPESLRKQVASATVISRDHTGHGIFTYLKVDASDAILPTTSGTVSTTMIVNLEHPAVPYGALTVLFVIDGYIHSLECAVFGDEDWPDDESLFTITLDERNSQ